MTEEQKEQKASDGIITEEILNTVAERIAPDNQQATAMVLKKLEPLFFKDILKTTADMKKYGRALGLSGINLDKLGDIIATTYIKGFITYQLAINKFDSKKLDEVYKQDWDAYCDRLIDAAEALKKEKSTKVIESIQPVRSDKGLESLLDGGDIA